MTQSDRCQLHNVRNSGSIRTTGSVFLLRSLMCLRISSPMLRENHHVKLTSLQYILAQHRTTSVRNRKLRFKKGLCQQPTAKNASSKLEHGIHTQSHCFGPGVQFFNQIYHAVNHRQKRAHTSKLKI